MISSEIHILLACYNGADYIREQIASIQRQTYTHWRLLVRDDGSQDGTPEIVKQLIEGDKRIRLVEKRAGDPIGGGAAANFAALLQLAAEGDGHYFMAADQDDVWREDKLQLLLAGMRDEESFAGRKAPILVHSDLEVVDRHLRTLHPSFLNFQGIRHEEQMPLRVLLAQNFVTGCALMFNRPLLDIALPVPKEVIMHDWWLALVASAAGRIGFVDEPTVQYRQHGRNQVGAKSLWHRLICSRGQAQARYRHFLAGIDQARHLACRLRDRSIPVDAALERVIQFYAGLIHTSRTDRIRLARQLGVGPQHLLRRAVFYFRLWRTAVKPQSAEPV